MLLLFLVLLLLASLLLLFALWFYRDSSVMNPIYRKYIRKKESGGFVSEGEENRLEISQENG